MGKSLQPQMNAIAVRQPANTPPSAGPAVPTPGPNEPATAESLGWQLRAALPPLRLHSVSLYDEQANVLWLSEGALGPDEHNVVVEAIDALGNDTSLTCYETGLEDGRVALFLPVRSPQGGLVGLAMILADIKSVGDGVIERLGTPQIRTIMQKVAVLLRPAQPRTSAGESLQALELAPEGPTVPPRAANSAPPVLSPKAVDAILEFELTPEPLPSSPPPSQTQRVAVLASFGGANLSLETAAEKPAVKSPPTVAAAIPMVNGTGKASPVSKPAINGAPTLAAAPSPQSVTPAKIATTSAPTPATHTNGAAAPSAVSKAALDSDLRLPLLDAPSTAFTGNVAPFPTPAGAASPVASVNGAGAPVPMAPATPATANPASTITSKAVNTTGTSKALNGSSDSSKSLSATSTSRVLVMPEGMSLTLEVQPFSKLRSGGRTRRYEVLARPSHPNRVPTGIDKIALQQLLAWMGANRSAWSLEPTSFTLNLSISTLEDERFPQFVASNLKTHGIAADNIGFEIAEPLCLQRRAQVERFITLCDKLGCFVVIDDFSLDSTLVNLLRSKALRLVKIDPKLTSVALKDKLAQAMVVAIAQAVKVLGIHCAAKRVESQAALQWLTAIGCDFAQGSALAQAQPLETLGQPTPAAGPPAA